MAMFAIDASAIASLVSTRTAASAPSPKRSRIARATASESATTSLR